MANGRGQSEGTVGFDSHEGYGYNTISWVTKSVNSRLGYLHENQSFYMN